jgi:hypothetical protein
MEGLHDVNIRSAQTLTRDSRVDHSVKSNMWYISEILQRRPLSEDRRLIEPVQSDKDGPFGGRGASVRFFNSVMTFPAARLVFRVAAMS